jgi:hypothetical protein
LISFLVSHRFHRIRAAAHATGMGLPKDDRGMKTSRVTLREPHAMRLAALASLATFIALSLAPAARARAGAGGEAAFFCFWIDNAHKQAATTALFRAQVADADDISSAFAKAMRRDAKGKGRVYDCGWRRDAVSAEQDRQSLRAAHVAKGFALLDVNWDPHIAER